MYTFIINPNARSGLGQIMWKSIENILKERQIPYQVSFTKYQTHATAMVRELTSDLEEHHIVVLGGDGTINEVINGITDLDKVTLGYIPIGSSNDFARGMGLPTSPEAALENILNPTNYVSLNVGVMTHGDQQQKTRRFAVSSGIGFDAGVCHQVMVTPLKKFLNKLKLGKLTYLAVALHRLLMLDARSMSITLDGTQTIDFERVYFATVMNLAYEGGGFKFCPKADCEDDLLDIIVINDLPRWKALLLLPTAFKGWHVHFHGVHIYTCKELDIRSEKPLPVHADGEPIFLQRHIHAKLEPNKLTFIGAPK